MKVTRTSAHGASPRAVITIGAVILGVCGVFGLSDQALAQTKAQTTAAAKPSLESRALSEALQYRLGAGDVIRINVYQNPDLSFETRVTDTGVISYPLLGMVDLNGLTLGEAEQRIAAMLKAGDFLKNPQVSIVVTQVRANQVNVLGQVGRPGRIPLDVAAITLTEVLARSGGVNDGGSEIIVVTGKRNGKPFLYNLDLPRLFTPEGQGDDMIMQPGDSVWVDRVPTVYLYGEIQRPGQLRLERGMTVMQALAAAGGFTQRGTQRGLRLHRRGADGKPLTLEPTMNDTLMKGDVLYVREGLF